MLDGVSFKGTGVTSRRPSLKYLRPRSLDVKLEKVY